METFEEKPLSIETNRPKKRGWGVYFLALLGITLVGTLGFWGYRAYQRSQDASYQLLSRLVELPFSSVQMPIEQEKPILFGNQFEIPRLESSSGFAVSVVKLADQSLPVIQLANGRKTIPIYVVNYAQLSNLKPFNFNVETLKVLEKERHFYLLHEVIKDRNPLIWRLRDDIYIAFLNADDVSEFTQNIRI